MITKTILFPTDFSDASKTAFQYAVDYARLANAKLLIAMCMSQCCQSSAAR